MPSSSSVSTAQQKAIQKADTLIEALGWIRKFRDTTTVIKLGGSVVEHPDSLRHLLIDIVFLSTLGMRIVVVHGGGKAISRAMDAAGIVPRFVQGRRFTDAATLAIVEQVLATDLNHELVARIEEYGGRAMSLKTTSFSAPIAAATAVAAVSAVTLSFSPASVWAIEGMTGTWPA